MAVPRVTRPFTGPDQGQLSPYLRANATPEHFGAGMARALGNAGEQLMRSGDSMVAREIRDQEIANESQARDALTQYKQATIDIWGKYGTTQGKTAVDGWGGYQAELKAAQQNILGTIQNENVKKAALANMEGWRLTMTSSGQTHMMREQQQWGKDSARAEQSQAIASATLMRNDFEKVHAQVDEGVIALARESRLNGDTQEIFDAKLRAYKGQAYGTVIDNLLQTDPFRAEALFKSVRDQLDPVSQGKIEEALKPKVLSARADEVVKGALNGNAGGETGYRNNIGNLTVSPAAWQGKGAPFKDFETFSTPEAGVAANFRNFRKIASEAGHNASLNDVARRWAPDDDGKTPLLKGNDSKAWARSVGQLAGIDPNAPLPLDNPEKMATVMKAVNRHEHGKQTVPEGSYLAGVNAVLSGTPVGTAPQRPSKDLLTQVYEATKDDPELQRLAMSRMQQSINAFDTATAQNRARLTAQAHDVKTALLAGQNVTIPETEIRQNFQADAADRMIGELNVAKVTGQAVAGLMLASPDQIAAARADITSGHGPLSDMLRSGFGYSGSEADKAKEAATRIEFQTAFERALAQRDKAISADPALYVQRDETVKAAMTVLQKDRSPEGWKQYVIATNASQERLGIPESNRRILTDAQRQNLVDAINRANPKGAADFLEGLRNQVGDEYWPQVFGELSRGEKGIPTGYIALGTIDPNDAVGRTTLAEVLQNEIDNKGAARKAAATLGKDVPNAIAQSVDEGMADYLRTFTVVDGGTALATGIIESAKLLAWHWAPTLGEDKAVSRAIATMAGMYDLEVSEGAYVARAPKGLGGDMASAANAAKGMIDPQSLVQLADRSTLYSSEEISNITLRNATKGYWVTSPTADGWTLLGANNEPVMRWVGRGATQRMVPVTLSYREVMSGDAPKAATAPPGQGTFGLFPTRPAGEDVRGRPYP